MRSWIKFKFDIRHITLTVHDVIGLSKGGEHILFQISPLPKRWQHLSQLTLSTGFCIYFEN